jgi:FkbH-like protein
MLRVFELQNLIFNKTTSRAELSNFKSTQKKNYKVTIYRNHSFELIEKTIYPYLEYAGLGVEFIYSDYDDSLSFMSLDRESDLVVLWLDLQRYEASIQDSFFYERISHLKSIFKKQILFAPIGKSIEIKDVEVPVYSFEQIKQNCGKNFFDLRMESFSGTKLSVDACLKISKDLGLNVFPALLKPALKGIVLDLDNTLYSGVLGEDGVSGVQLTEGHKLLQMELKRLGQQGFFLCVASKNDERDVLKLFENRYDFPLQLSDFSKIVANWESKSNSIGEIAAFLNINTDSLLFIDDNYGELVSVINAHPNIWMINAVEDAFLTLEMVKNFPGLLKMRTNREDSLRKSDTVANLARQELQASLSKEDYISSLKLELDFQINNLEHAPRVHELSNKTNQFIFSYKRFAKENVLDLMKSTESAVITISLKDKLSDSGIIGAIVLSKMEMGIELQECFVSCRALGRGIDELIVMGAIKFGLDYLSSKQIFVNFLEGERNLPAKKFIDQNLKQYTSAFEFFDFEIPNRTIQITVGGKIYE